MQQYYALIAGEVVGPLTGSELRALAASGRLKRTDKVKRSTDPAWFNAHQIKGMEFHSGPAALITFKTLPDEPPDELPSTSDEQLGFEPGPVPWAPAPAASKTPYRVGPRSTAGLGDFLEFRRMITPGLIRTSYLVGSVLLVMGCLVYCIVALRRETGPSGLLLVAGGLGLTVVVLVAYRVYCELLILLFRMHESLTDIERGLRERS